VRFIIRYLGGKSRTWKSICAFLESVRKPNQTYLEPFVGGAWVLQGMSGKRIASDYNQSLITLYQSLQQGWIPPTEVSLELYKEVQAKKDPLDPLTAFVGFGCSFGGKWFGGYAKDDLTRKYSQNAFNSLNKARPLIKGVEFSYKSYLEYTPVGYLIYCDPPYQNTTGYGAIGSFNTELFWETMRQWSLVNTVVVSEYQAPPDFRCVLEIATKTDMRMKDGTKDQRVERLFMFRGTEPHQVEQLKLE